jgi:hypothetical protein
LIGGDQGIERREESGTAVEAQPEARRHAGPAVLIELVAVPLERLQCIHARHIMLRADHSITSHVRHDTCDQGAVLPRGGRSRCAEGEREPGERMRHCTRHGPLHRLQGDAAQ